MIDLDSNKASVPKGNILLEYGVLWQTAKFMKGDLERANQEIVRLKAVIEQLEEGR